MSDPNAATETHAPGAAEHSSTSGRGPPEAADAALAALGTPTQAANTISTPSHESAERITQHRPAAQAVESVTTFPRLPAMPGYDVQRFVGRGGMGVVYQALHLATGRTVALKLIHPGEVDDPVSRERFAREIHALAQLEHPNIVPVYDAGEWHGFPFCTMKFIPGGNLNEHLDRIRGDLRSAVWLVAKVAHAVAVLHSAGVLHRDLKPLNILLSDDDEPLVADFGLAKWVNSDSTLTDTGCPVGTRHYMSPEQTVGRREDYTTACDIWALGVLLYEVLTGQRPFRDDGRTDLYHRIRTDDPPPAASLAPEVPAALEAVALKCLAKRPEDRYPSAAAVAADLEHWLAGEPVSATPAMHLTVVESPVPPTPAKKPRRRVLFASVAVLVLLAAAGVAAFQLKTPSDNAEPQPTLADRVAAGKKVKLTDEKGRPLVEVVPAEGHEFIQKDRDGLNHFCAYKVGLASLADENWGMPIRVEADVAVPHETPYAMGGVYVARRAWPDLEFKHETLVYFAVVPLVDLKTKARQLSGEDGFHWWDRNRIFNPRRWAGKLHPWDRGPAKELHPRWAHVVIEVRAKEIRGSVDGLELKPITEQDMLEDLNLKVKRGERVGFPRTYRFPPPAFGTGIGLFCKQTQYVVRNLTVSKLNP